MFGIKKVKSTKNEYVYSGDVWVRNFTKLNSTPIQETSLIKQSDVDLILHNERSNHTLNLENIAERNFLFPIVIIVSDGYKFEEKIQFLKKTTIPICIIAVNKALKKWPIAQEKPINFYLINNPYKEAVYFLPTKYFPACIASTRTNFNFLSNYPGVKYVYEPTPEKGFGYQKHEKYFIDDYRNPISAALNIAFRFGSKKVMLIGCDNSFPEKREGAVELLNGLKTFPQHIRNQEIIDAQLFWLMSVGVKISDYSSGLEYKHAAYIKDEEEALSFISEDES